MEDKVLDLMAKMYEDLSSKMDKIQTNMERIETRIDIIEEKLDQKADKSDILKLEHKLEENSKALFDGYSQVYEKLTTIDGKVEDLTFKVAKQDVEIRVIKNSGY